MPKNVQLPDNSVVEFPDSMSDQDIGQAIDHHLMSRPDLQAPPEVPNPRQMETSMLGHLAPRDVPRSDGAGASQAGMPGFEGAYASGDEGKAKFMTGVGAAAGTALGGAQALPFVAAAAVRHPVIASMVASEAITAARKIPGIGHFIPPYSELLPFLFSGGKGAAAEAEAGGAAIERDATRINKPFAGEEIPSPVSAPPKTAPVYRDATYQNKPFAGEVPAKPRTGIDSEALPWNSVKNTVEPPAKAVSNQPIGQPSASDPFSQRQVTPSTQNIRENEALARQAEQTRPTKTYNSRDSIEDRGINQEFAQDLEKHGMQADEEAKREFAARNTSYTSKADMAKNVKVKTVKTPSAAPSDDLTPVLQKMLDNARKGKPIK